MARIPRHSLVIASLMLAGCATSRPAAVKNSPPPLPPLASMPAGGLAGVLPEPVTVTNVLEATFPAQVATSAFFTVSYDAVNWAVFASVEYPQDGAVLRATNVFTHGAAFYRAGISP